MALCMPGMHRFLSHVKTCSPPVPICLQIFIWCFLFKHHNESSVSEGFFICSKDSYYIKSHTVSFLSRKMLHTLIYILKAHD